MVVLTTAVGLLFGFTQEAARIVEPAPEFNGHVVIGAGDAIDTEHGLGRADSMQNVVMVWHTAGVKSLEDMKEKEVIDQIRKSLSAAIQVGRHLWLGCDETATLERLTHLGGGRWGEALSARIVQEGVERLAPEGRLVLYTGAVMVEVLDRAARTGDLFFCRIPQQDPGILRRAVPRRAAHWGGVAHGTHPSGLMCNTPGGVRRRGRRHAVSGADPGTLPGQVRRRSDHDRGRDGRDARRGNVGGRTKAGDGGDQSLPGDQPGRGLPALPGGKAADLRNRPGTGIL